MDLVYFTAKSVLTDATLLIGSTWLGTFRAPVGEQVVTPFSILIGSTWLGTRRRDSHLHLVAGAFSILIGSTWLGTYQYSNTRSISSTFSILIGSTWLGTTTQPAPGCYRALSVSSSDRLGLELIVLPEYGGVMIFQYPHRIDLAWNYGTYNGSAGFLAFQYPHRIDLAWNNA